MGAPRAPPKPTNNHEVKLWNPGTTWLVQGESHWGGVKRKEKFSKKCDRKKLNFVTHIGTKSQI